MFYWIGSHMESNVKSLLGFEVTQIKQLEVEGSDTCPSAPLLETPMSAVFLRRAAYAAAFPSVRPSVRPSVTLVNCIIIRLNGSNWFLLYSIIINICWYLLLLLFGPGTDLISTHLVALLLLLLLLLFLLFFLLGRPLQKALGSVVFVEEEDWTSIERLGYTLMNETHTMMGLRLQLVYIMWWFVVRKYEHHGDRLRLLASVCW